MRHKRTFRGLQAVPLTAAALIASVASPVAVAKDNFADFTAVIQISEVLQVPSNAPNCQPTDPAGSAALGFITGSGLASVIGAFSLESVDCVRSATPLPYFYPPFEFSSTTFKLTDSNGHQIIASYGGTAVVDPTGLLVLNGTFTFTSGTGKYSKVQGGGTLRGVEYIGSVPATGFVTLSGTISR